MMNFIQYINYNSIVELDEATFESTVKELLLTCNFKGNIADLVAELISKEKETSSVIGNKIAVLNARIANIPSRYEILIGRAKTDIKFGIGKNVEPVNTIILVLAAKHERSFLSILSGLVVFFQNPQVVNRLQLSDRFDVFKETLTNVLKKHGKTEKNIRLGENEHFLKHAVEIAHKTHCTSLMLLGNVSLDNVDIEGITDDIKLINVVQNSSTKNPVMYDSHIELHVTTLPSSWTQSFRGAILFGITREIISYDEKICCLGCNGTPGILDLLFIVDVHKEFRPIFASNTKFLQAKIQPEVLERTLSIASEIAVEGREGKAVGCLFVIGDINKIALFTKPLVLNPFHGYPESERNILNAFMNETIKEFSLIDGAFVVRGDGIIESAGTLIYTPNHNIVMPSGFGTRHAAAASISWAAECVSIAVSESTRAVTLFQNGQMLQVMQK